MNLNTLFFCIIGLASGMGLAQRGGCKSRFEAKLDRNPDHFGAVLNVVKYGQSLKNQKPDRVIQLIQNHKHRTIEVTNPVKPVHKPLKRTLMRRDVDLSEYSKYIAIQSTLSAKYANTEPINIAFNTYFSIDFDDSFLVVQNTEMGKDKMTCSLKTDCGYLIYVEVNSSQARTVTYFAKVGTFDGEFLYNFTVKTNLIFNSKGMLLYSSADVVHSKVLDRHKKEVCLYKYLGSKVQTKSLPIG